MTSNQTTPAQPGIAISTPITAGAVWPQHAEGIVVSTAIVAGGEPGLATNHAEGVVVATAIAAGGAAIANNHVETLVLR